MQQAYLREEVEQELTTVLQDAKFAAAPQMSAFLKFVVTQTLDGKADRIKAYTVAVDALGKPATFDPQNDPSVRVLAKRLRDTLSAYYERTNGHKVFLRLRSGSYIPNFETSSELDKSANAPSMIATANVTPITRSTETSDHISDGMPGESTINGEGIKSSDVSYRGNKLAKP